MLKKKIIFGSVVLLLAALFALTGCSQATDSDSTTVYSENHLFGNATPDYVAAAVASARNTGRSVVLTPNVRITDFPAAPLPSVVSFENLPVRVEGAVTVTAGVIVNAAFANLSFEPNASITVERGGVFIYQGNGDNIFTDRDNPGFKVKYMLDPLQAVQGTDLHVAVPSYTIGSNFADVAIHVTHLYVLDKVTVTALSAVPPGATSLLKIIPLREVDFTENNSAAFAAAINTVAANPGFNLTANTVLTSSVGDVTITVPDDAILPTIRADRPITIAPGDTQDLTIASVEGPETVTIITATSIGDLDITVAQGGRVAVSTGTLTDFDITNAGTINIAASTAVTAGLLNNAATGTISFTTPAYGALGVVATPVQNAGTITITAPAINGPIVVGSNAGTIDLDTPTDGGAISGTVAVAVNSGTINYATPSITAISTITRNTGEINFTKDLTGIANFLKVPANNNAVNFRGSLNAAAFGSAAVPGDAIAGTGKVVFGGLASFGGDTVIGCDTEFDAGLTRTADVALTLNGNVTLGYEQSIALTGATGLILGAGKQISVGINPVLAAGKDPVTIVAAGATLTAGTEFPGDTDDPETFVGNKTLTLTIAPITAITNELHVPGVLNLNFTGNAVGPAGSLILDEGGILAIANNNAAPRTVTIEDTVITGPALVAANSPEARFIAVGGPITLKANEISGNGSILRVVQDLGIPTITVDPGAAGTKTLTITKAKLDLYNGGSLGINASGGAAGTQNRVVLVANETSPAGLILGDTTTYSLSNLNNRVLTGGGNNATLIGNGIVRGDNETFPIGIGELNAAPYTNLTIRGQLTAGDDVIILAGRSVL
jgi:hypothetical protein